METIRRTKIVDLLKCRDFGTMVNVKGGFVLAVVANR